MMANQMTAIQRNLQLLVDIVLETSKLILRWDGESDTTLNDAAVVGKCTRMTESFTFHARFLVTVLQKLAQRAHSSNLYCMSMRLPSSLSLA